MTKAFDLVPLAGSAPGTRRLVPVRRYGTPGARPKAYLQASLHADEIPPLLVAHHLARLLDLEAAGGRIRGEVVLVAPANPIGLGQVVDQRAMGRFELASGVNFNRAWTDLTAEAARRLDGRLGPDPSANVALVRRALVEAAAARAPRTEADSLRHALLGLAIDADIVLDLHCDDEALLHIYLGSPLWPAAADLPRQLGAEAVLVAEASGGDPFDEACSAPWWRLPALLGLGEGAIPPACLAATVELRGAADVDDGLAAEDAGNILRFLIRRGVVEGKAGPLPAARCQATPLAGVDMLRSPVAGIVVHRVGLGAFVAAGDPVADIVDPAAPDPAAARTTLLARTAGPLWARVAHRFARPDEVIAKIAGAEPLAGRTGLLLTAR